jgi:hypothetical protein
MTQNSSSFGELDRLSQSARVVLKMNVESAYTKLVVSGAGHADAYPILRALSPELMLSQRPSNVDEAAAMLAGLWLWQDCLDESHKVSQSLHTVSGSMWHAIMHRREGDFSNSKYWYARCENHPALTTLAAKAGDAINPFPADKQVLKITHRGWNADALVDLVKEVCDRPSDPRYALAVALQQLEWRVLFDHCMRAAQ